MTKTTTLPAEHLLHVHKQIDIDAPLAVVFASLLEQIGAGFDTPDGKPMPLKIEPWPGGRWYRDLGDGNGHLWAHVQAIKRPTLLEFAGPLFMSYPVSSNVQYRLKEENGVTRLRFVHRAMASIAHDPRIRDEWSQVENGWGGLLERIRTASVKK